MGRMATSYLANKTKQLSLSLNDSCFILVIEFVNNRF